MERDKRTDLGRLGEVKDKEDLMSMSPERFEELARDTGMDVQAFMRRKAISDMETPVELVNMYSVHCNVDLQPLTLKALQDALVKMGEAMEKAARTIQPLYLVMGPKMAKSYRRREKRKRHRDDKLVVTPARSFYDPYKL